MEEAANKKKRGEAHHGWCIVAASAAAHEAEHDDGDEQCDEADKDEGDVDPPSEHEQTDADGDDDLRAEPDAAEPADGEHPADADGDPGFDFPDEPEDELAPGGADEDGALADALLREADIAVGIGGDDLDALDVGPETPPAEDPGEALAEEGPAALLPPLPPPPEVEEELPSRLVMGWGSGTLTWYKYSGEMVAMCKLPGHKCGSGCRKHRVTSERESRPAQGRPIGYLAAWLSQHGHEFHSGKDHKAWTPSLAERQAAREAFTAAGGDSARILARERRQRVEAGEPAEPELCP